MADHDFESVERFTAGAIGEPGARTFLLQVDAAGQRLTVKAEKQQVAALAEYLEGVLADLADVPEVAVSTDLDLRPPFEIDWVAGTLSVAYDDGSDRIVILIEEATFDDEPDELRSSLRVRLTRAQVTALVGHATALVEGGRPPCALCGHPKGPDHACPTTNGHGPPH